MKAKHDMMVIELTYYHQVSRTRHDKKASKPSSYADLRNKSRKTVSPDKAIQKIQNYFLTVIILKENNCEILTWCLLHVHIRKIYGMTWMFLDSVCERREKMIKKVDNGKIEGAISWLEIK